MRDNLFKQAMVASAMVQAEEIPSSELSALDKALTYEAVTNYSRAVKGAAQMCVMCGKSSGHARSSVVIPRQNKDVCRDCDKAIWQHAATRAYFKWCKGCKNFLQIGNFSQKLDAAKCDKCRERGRTSYLLKKRHAKAVESDDDEPVVKDEPPDSAAAISLVALARTDDVPKVSSSFGRALASVRSDDDDDRADPTECVAVFRKAPGLLFELAAIHSTILKLEQQADKVAPLEAKVQTLERALADSRKREADARRDLARYDDDPNKRPRIISFDATSVSTDSSPVASDA